MKQSLSIGQIGTLIAHSLRRYHIVLFSLTIVIGVSLAIFLLNGLINLSNDNSSMSTAPATVFDEDTIKKINDFASSQEGEKDFILPPGRINPFIK